MRLSLPPDPPHLLPKQGCIYGNRRKYFNSTGLSFLLDGPGPRKNELTRSVITTMKDAGNNVVSGGTLRLFRWSKRDQGKRKRNGGIVTL